MTMIVIDYSDSDSDTGNDNDTANGNESEGDLKGVLSERTLGSWPLSV